MAADNKWTDLPRRNPTDYLAVPQRPLQAVECDRTAVQVVRILFPGHFYL